MEAAFLLTDSSLALTSPSHTPSPKMSLELAALASEAGPYTRPLSHIAIDDTQQRRSDRKPAAMEAADVSAFLQLACVGRDGRRPYPAAGGIYTIQTYLIARRVAGLDAGLHYLRPSQQQLEYLGHHDACERFVTQAVLQEGGDAIPLMVLLVADLRLARTKYHDRAQRMAMLEAGALVQTMYLAAARLELSACALGAISDRAALKLCCMPADEHVMFACGLSLGRLQKHAS